jgi:hypothetical protein
MGTITTLRPSTVSSGVGWSAVPSGTLSTVTSDDIDSTYALWSGSGSALILGTPVDSPPAGERRHQARLSARGEDGNAWWSVRLSSGALIAGAAAQFTASPSTVVGSWGFGAPPDGATILYTYVTGQSSGVKINELYLDVDTREAPTFTPQILDGSGTPTTTISDTTQPVIRADAIDLDALNARQYRYWVTLGADIVWDTGVVSGASVNRETTPLDNGSYVAHLQIWSTLGQNTAYASDEETLAFTLTVGAVQSPDNPEVDPLDGTPFYTLSACAPFVDDLDGEVGWIEIQRIDCPDDVPTSTTVAILGPLETGECADWVDFTLPRTGSSSVCDPSIPCCSYYRARTVGRIDGDLRISDWSDSYNPGVPRGMIVMWPSTAASVPDGWDRTTELDGKYPKGIATSSTAPGATGGAATHTHTVPTHTHDETHTHTHTGNTGVAVGALNSTPNTVGSTEIQASHTHTRSTTSSAVVSSGTATPVIGTAANDPARLEVIFIESDGTPLGVPDDAVALTPDISLSGWTGYANAASRFFKGAAAAGDGGATVASATAAHNHSIAAHTHGGTAHSHTATANSASSDRTLTSGAQQVLAQSAHTHAINAASTSTQALASGGSGTSGDATPDEPPFRNLRAQQNTSGAPDLPVGLICAWRGSLGAIPDFWQLCDGTNGTYDMSAWYPKGATASIGTTGGSLNAHSHTSPSHSHTTTGHSHTETVASAAATTTGVSTTSTLSVATGTHTHTATDTNSTTPTVGSSTSGTLASTTTEPPYEEVAFVQLMETPTPPPDPDRFCLDWDDDYHLIRTLGPTGPMWADVKGKFEWDVDRPFTSANGVNGSRFVTSAPPGGRNLHLNAAVESEEELAILHAVLGRPLVLVSPSDAEEVWAAPVAESVRIIKVGRIRQVTADFIGTGPQPPPQLADVGV